MYPALKDLNIGLIAIYGFVLFAPISTALSQICIGITILGWILKMVQNKSLTWKKTPLDIPILIFVLTQIIPVLTSRHIPDALNTWIDNNWFILFYYAIINLLNEETDYKKIFIFLAISGTVSAAYGIFQHFTGIDIIRGYTNIWPYGNFHRATGFFSMPLTYGGVQLVIFILLFPFYFIDKKFLKQKLFLIVLILLFFSIIASYARSAWLGFALTSVFLLSFLPKKYVITLVGTAITGLVAIYFIHPDLLFRQGLFSMFDISENAPYNNLVRMKLWESTWAMIKDNWLFGIGYSHFDEIFATYKVPFDYRGLSEPHNEYLRVFAVSGIFGGLAFIYLWVYDLKTKYFTYRKPRFFENLTVWKAGSIGSFFTIFALMVASLTQEYYQDAETGALWWFITAIGMIGVMKKDTNMS